MHDERNTFFLSGVDDYSIMELQESFQNIVRESAKSPSNGTFCAYDESWKRITLAREDFHNDFDDVE